jgi:hypothetical protein
MVGFEVITPGRTTKISRGATLIHSAFHIDSPSVTLVARTHQDATPELTYLPPGLAYNSGDRSPHLHKKLQLLDTLSMTGHAIYTDAVRAAIEVGDFFNDFAVLIRAGGHDIDEALFQSFAEQLRRKHRDFVAIDTAVLAAFEERRRFRLVRCRHILQAPDERLFLALLLCFNESVKILEAAINYVGKHDAACELIAAGVSRLVGGDADRQALARAAALILLEAGSEDGFLTVVTKLTSSDLSSDQAKKMRQFFRQVSGHPLLKPLFSGMPKLAALEA